MNESRCIRNLALAGFMGSGKSSVGRLAARQLRFQFVDTDELIEMRAGKTISTLFEEDGEAFFRVHEREVVSELSTQSETVIATGGGLVLSTENRAALKSHALVVCLWAGPETIWQRVRHQTHRPLLQTPDPLSTIARLLAQREAAYRQADVLVNTEQRSLSEVVQQVVHHFRASLHAPDPASR